MICPWHEVTYILTQLTGNKVHVSVKKLCIVLSHLNHGDTTTIRKSVNENQLGVNIGGLITTISGRMTDPAGSPLKVEAWSCTYVLTYDLIQNKGHTTIND